MVTSLRLSIERQPKEPSGTLTIDPEDLFSSPANSHKWLYYGREWRIVSFISNGGKMGSMSRECERKPGKIQEKYNKKGGREDKNWETKKTDGRKGGP